MHRLYNRGSGNSGDGEPQTGPLVDWSASYETPPIVINPLHGYSPLVSSARILVCTHPARPGIDDEEWAEVDSRVTTLQPSQTFYSIDMPAPRGTRAGN